MVLFDWKAGQALDREELVDDLDCWLKSLDMILRDTGSPERWVTVRLELAKPPLAVLGEGRDWRQGQHCGGSKEDTQGAGGPSGKASLLASVSQSAAPKPLPALGHFGVASSHGIRQPPSSLISQCRLFHQGKSLFGESLSLNPL